jgi:hypothetical protein
VRQVSAVGKFFEVLLGVLEDCLPDLDDEAISSLLWARAKPPMEVLSDLFADDQVRDCFDEADLKVVDHLRADSAKAAKTEFAQELTKHMAEVKARAEKKEKGKKRKRAAVSASQSAPRPAAHKWHAPSPPKGDTVTEADARQYLPPASPARLWKDMVWCDRWLVKYAPYGTLSRSFQLYGEVNALARCLNWVWYHHGLTNPGVQCPFPWVLEADWKVGAK